MSFKKIQIINPWDIGCPEEGHIYFGRDNVGLWEKYSNCQWVYITTGNTTGDGTSGTSGFAGSSGVDGGFYGSSGADGISGSAGTSGKSGSSGRSGFDGISGSNGLSGSSGFSGTSGKSGTSGISGSTGTSGKNGSSGSSGVSSNGSSGTSGNTGTSGTSGGDGAYGAATRTWNFTNISSPVSGEFYANENYLGLITTLLINSEDSDLQDVSHWLETWNSGLLKIEKWGDASIFGIYDGCMSSFIGGRYQISSMNEINSNGPLIPGDRYLLSFIKTSPFVPISFIPNSGIEYISSNEAHTKYNTSINPSSTTPIAVGGILSGTTASSLSGKTLVEVIDNLLFPTIPPTYILPYNIGNEGQLLRIPKTGNTLEWVTIADEKDFTFNDIDVTFGNEYIMNLKSRNRYKIDRVALKCDTGTVTLTIKINSIDVTDLTDIDVNDGLTEFVSTGNNIVNVGDLVTLTITNLIDSPLSLSGNFLNIIL